MKVVSLFIAGGTGKRLWPKSDSTCPKQFVDVLNCGKTLLEATIERMSFVSSCEDMYLITDIKFRSIIKSIKLPIPESNIIYEPFGRNTSPAINLSMKIIKEKYLEDVIVIAVPCDHFISNFELFKRAIHQAVNYCSKTNSIGTIGIVPTFPNTNFGYIKKGHKLEDGMYLVDVFKEKPFVELAEEYVASKKYLWNSGIFIFKLETIMKEFMEHSQEQYTKIAEYHSNNLHSFEQLSNIYDHLKNSSFDKNIIEKSKNLFVVQGEFDWDDLGTWPAVEKYYCKDENANIVNDIKNILLDDCKNVSVISYSGDIIISSGLEDVLIVSANNKILIIKKDKIKDIPNLVNLVEKN